MNLDLALRDLAGGALQEKGNQHDARLRPGTEWFVTSHAREQKRRFKAPVSQGKTPPYEPPQGESSG